MLSRRHILPRRTGAVLHLHAHRARFCYFSNRNVHLAEHNEEKPTNAEEIHKGTNTIREMGLLREDGMGQHQYHAHHPSTLLSASPRWNAIDSHR